MFCGVFVQTLWHFSVLGLLSRCFSWLVRILVGWLAKYLQGVSLGSVLKIKIK
jgi:hypothetical protein